MIMEHMYPQSLKHLVIPRVARYDKTFAGEDEFEVAMANGLGGDAFTKNTLLDLDPKV